VEITSFGECLTFLSRNGAAPLPSQRLRAAIAARFEERIELCGIGRALQTIEKRAELGRFVLELSQRCTTIVVEGRVAETTRSPAFEAIARSPPECPAPAELAAELGKDATNAKPRQKQAGGGKR
jgi:hypothetical protein